MNGESVTKRKGKYPQHLESWSTAAGKDHMYDNDGQRYVVRETIVMGRSWYDLYYCDEKGNAQGLSINLHRFRSLPAILVMTVRW